MDQSAINDFRDNCKTVYNYYRVKMIRNTPFLQPKSTVSSQHFIIFFAYLEASISDMDKLANPHLSDNPHLQDQLDAVIYSYIIKYNSISALLRRRFKK